MRSKVVTPATRVEPSRRLLAVDDQQRLRYRNAANTDIRRTFMRAKREIAARQAAEAQGQLFLAANDGEDSGLAQVLPFVPAPSGFGRVRGGR